MAEGAWDAVKDFFDINSPSKKMMWIGEMVDKGLTKGIEDSADLVKDAMNDISVVPEVQTSAFDAGTALGANSAASTESNTNNVVINVYGAVGQDMNELAEIIEQKITAATRRREGAFA
jgi:ABC-type sulfate transport system substrate-binding protein